MAYPFLFRFHPLFTLLSSPRKRGRTSAAVVVVIEKNKMLSYRRETALQSAL